MRTGIKATLRPVICLICYLFKYCAQRKRYFWAIHAISRRPFKWNETFFDAMNENNTVVRPTRPGSPIVILCVFCRHWYDNLLYLPISFAQWRRHAILSTRARAKLFTIAIQMPANLVSVFLQRLAQSLARFGDIGVLEMCVHPLHQFYNSSPGNTYMARILERLAMRLK